MTEYGLTARVESIGLLAELFQQIGDDPATIGIIEDRCFQPDAWLNIGQVLLRPSQPEPGMEKPRTIRAAIRNGFFEWHCPRAESLVMEAFRKLGLEDGEREDQRNKARRGLEGIVGAACRVGLLHPVFDSESVRLMPFRRPTTVVADTSAIVQGGLDFVVRFLYPMARVKVPAIAHMELLNAADNYLSLRRKAPQNSAGRILAEHAFSQGGQRVLLRLELQTDTEIERGRLGADPLRGIVQPGSDAEDRSLGLSVVQRSFADRLIFETARQHSGQASPDHPVLVLTCDQGLARMTISEGMQPLFFDANKLSAVDGRILTGTAFHPFTGHLYGVCLADLLWELAVTFGAARLAHAPSGCLIEVSAIGADLPWKPYHAKDDLLWVRNEGLATGESPSGGPVAVEGRRSILQPTSEEPSVSGVVVEHTAEPAPSEPASTAGGQVVSRSESKGQSSQAVVTETRAGQEPKRAVAGDRRARLYTGFYKFSPARMLALVRALHERTEVRATVAMAALGTTSASQLEDYRNFLVSGGFVTGDARRMVKTEELDRLWFALKALDRAEIGRQLRGVPSFARFIEHIIGGAVSGEKVPSRSIPTYRTLAEIAGLAATIPDERIYATFSDPSPSEFAEMALSVYENLPSTSDEYVLTGEWLEGLIKGHGIHPLVSRQRLEEARAEGLIQRYAEGSTPDTRFGRHSLSVLELEAGLPVIRAVGLYEGGFLIPGRGSVTIKLKKGDR